MNSIIDGKKCPRCAELIQREATACRYCGHDFEAAKLARQKKQADAEGWRTTAKGCGCLVVILVGFVASMSMMPKSEEDTAKKAAEKQQGFHCVGGMDGSSFRFISAVKAQLREPTSFEHIKTGIRHEQDGKHYILMDFRSRNGFGGMTVAKARGYVDHATCEVVGTVSISTD